MKLFGLIGYPLSHSFSKKYFTNKFLEEGIYDCSFELFPLTHIDELPAMLQANKNLIGFSVTIPYKQLVIPFLDDVSALPLQACNCIKITDGKLKGYNTDVLGFEKSFVQNLLPHHTSALVLGSGGASVAVQYVLNKLGIGFTVVSRNPASGLGYQHLNEAIINDNPIIINTTPLGTFPETDACAPILYPFITAKHYCYDLVYNPPFSLFLTKAAEQGAVTKNGHDMLLIQAEKNWEIWNG